MLANRDSNTVYQENNVMVNILTVLIPGSNNKFPITGTRRRKLITTGKNPLEIRNNQDYLEYLEIVYYRIKKLFKQ